jgi:hypothetical protein
MVSFADLLGIVLTVLVLRYALAGLPPVQGVALLDGGGLLSAGEGSTARGRETPGFDDGAYLAAWLDYRLTRSGVAPQADITAQAGMVRVRLPGPVDAQGLADVVRQINRPVVLGAKPETLFAQAGALRAAGLTTTLSLERDSGAAEPWLLWEGLEP